MSSFNFDSPAELFSARARNAQRQITYRRFEQAAEAIRFAVEDLASDILYGTYLEVDDQRFDAAAIRRLYASTEFPLARLSNEVPINPTE